MFSFFPSVFYSTEWTARTHDHSVVPETLQVQCESGSEPCPCRVGCQGTRCVTEARGAASRATEGPAVRLCPQGKFVMRPIQCSPFLLRVRGPESLVCNSRGSGVGWLTGRRLFFIYLFIFRERGREGEREGEKYQCVVASRAPPMVDLACNPGMCPDWESNWQPFGSQPALNLLS